VRHRVFGETPEPLRRLFPAGGLIRIKRIILGAVVLFVGVPLAVVLIALATIAGFGRTDSSIVSSGVERQYLLHVPESVGVLS
jgi:hypothetical protein